MSKPSPQTKGQSGESLLAIYLKTNQVPPAELPGVIAAFRAGGLAVGEPIRVRPAKAAKAKAKKAKKAAPAPKAARVRPRKQVAKADNSGAFLVDVAIPTQSVKKAKGTANRGKFLGVRDPSDPAVPIDQSVTQDHLICLEDGRKFKMMKRWLRATYGMSPEEYKAKWNLPTEYPMVAPGYAREKSDYAKIQGLGTIENKQHAKSSVKDLNSAVASRV
jgi:predicted transcriptional regulator